MVGNDARVSGSNLDGPLLESLERQIRRSESLSLGLKVLSWFLVLSLLLSGYAIYVGLAVHPVAVQYRQVDIVSEEGTRVATLGATTDGTGTLELFDSDGIRRVGLGTDEKGLSVITLYDGTGERMSRWAASTDSVGLVMMNSDQKPAVILFAGGDQRLLGMIGRESTSPSILLMSSLSDEGNDTSLFSMAPLNSPPSDPTQAPFVCIVGVAEDSTEFSGLLFSDSHNAPKIGMMGQPHSRLETYGADGSVAMSWPR